MTFNVGLSFVGRKAIPLIPAFSSKPDEIRGWRSSEITQHNMNGKIWQIRQLPINGWKCEIFQQGTLSCARVPQNDKTGIPLECLLRGHGCLCTLFKERESCFEQSIWIPLCFSSKPLRLNFVFKLCFLM